MSYKIIPTSQFEKELKRLYKLYPYKTELNNQEKAFIVTGTISDCQKVVYPDAKIINLNSLKETTSDFDGNFSFEKIKTSSNEHFQKLVDRMFSNE